MRSLLVMASLFAGSCMLAAPALAGDVLVRVSGVRSDKGSLRVAVCTQSTFLKGDCPYRAKVPARPGTMDVTVRGVPPGTYAILAHHNIYDDGEVHQNFFGLPTEGIGFSRAPSLFHRPSFAETAIRIGDALVQVDIALKFEP